MPAAISQKANIATNESHTRSITKGFTWRILGTLDTIIISYFITGNPWKALSIGGIEVFTKVILYYFHERIWQKISWGRNAISEHISSPKKSLK